MLAKFIPLHFLLTAKFTPVHLPWSARFIPIHLHSSAKVTPINLLSSELLSVSPTVIIQSARSHPWSHHVEAWMVGNTAHPCVHALYKQENSCAIYKTSPNLVGPLSFGRQEQNQTTFIATQPWRRGGGARGKGEQIRFSPFTVLFALVILSFQTVYFIYIYVADKRFISCLHTYKSQQQDHYIQWHVFTIEIVKKQEKWTYNNKKCMTTKNVPFERLLKPFFL